MGGSALTQGRILLNNRDRRNYRNIGLCIALCVCRLTSVHIDRLVESGEAHLKKTECTFGNPESIAPSKQQSLTPGSSAATSANPPAQVEAHNLRREPSVPRTIFISSCGDSSGSSMS